MKKRLLFLSIAFVISLTAWSDDGVCLLLRSGETVGFRFKEKPVIVTGANIEIKTAETTVSYNYSDVVRLYFDQVVPSGITNLPSDDAAHVSFSITPSGISVKGLAQGVRVAVHTLDGKLVTSAIAPSSTAVEIGLPQEGHGIYLVSTSSGVSFKIAKQ